MIPKALGIASLMGLTATNISQKEAKCWIYRDDIGAFWGIKGYEETVSEVGGHNGHVEFPQYKLFGTYDAGSVRRGFQVFSKNCANCHGMIYRKYDFVLDKGYRQKELSSAVSMFSISPGHHHFKQYYYQEWDERDRVITDHIYPQYISQDHAKKSNGGVFPTDFSKINRRAGNIMYIYNILTGYHFKPPKGLDVPKGKHFNPYFDHMIIGMARQLHDGMIDYDDGTPASTPQMAYDVSNFITFMQRRVGGKLPDRLFRYYLITFALVLTVPLRYVLSNGAMRNIFTYRLEAYAVRDGNYFKHFRTGQRNSRASHKRALFWS